MTQFVRNFNTHTTTPRTSTTTTSSTITSSSTGTTIDTLPGVFCNENDLQAIKQAYSSCIGELKASVAWYLENLMQWGMEPEVILNAIHETGWARRPTPHYMRAILERYKAWDIKTMAQLLHDQQEFAESKKWYEE